jgi:hypothetical protein
MALSNTFASGKHQAKILLCGRVSLKGGEPVPADGLDRVLWDALSPIVHYPQTVLGRRTALVGGESEPTGSLGIALVYTSASEISEGKIVLRLL